MGLVGEFPAKQGAADRFLMPGAQSLQAAQSYCEANANPTHPLLANSADRAPPD